MGGLKACRADNPRCGLKTGASELFRARALRCDICCSEPGFCPECKCLLCCCDVAPGDGGDSLQCLQLVGGSSNGGVCGHSVHLRCALGCRLAGVVDNLVDVEYLCRRCGNKMDLAQHAAQLLKSASASTTDAAQRYLSMALQLVHGSKRPEANALEHAASAALNKVDGVCLDSSDVHGKLLAMPLEAPLAWEQAVELLSRPLAKVSLDGNDDVPSYASLVTTYERSLDEALRGLQRAQQKEMEVAKEALTVQMHRVLEAYKGVLRCRSSFVKDFSLSKESCASEEGQLQRMANSFRSECTKMVESLGHERRRWDEMLRIQFGFGSVSRELLRDSFRCSIPKT